MSVETQRNPAPAEAVPAPWQRGPPTPVDGAMTALEAVRKAGLDWEVQKQPLYTGPDRNVRIKGRFAVCRTDQLDSPDGGQLGVVGADYTPLQNSEAFSFLDPVVGEGRAVYHTVGSLDGGRRLWLLSKLPGEIRVVGEDVTEKYLLLANSHDGTTAVRILFTPIRVVCRNTLNLALRTGGGLTIRHYPDVKERVDQARRILGIVEETYAKAGESFRRMTKVEMTGVRLREYFGALMPLPADEEARTKVAARHTRLTELFETGDGNSLPGVRGTLWAAYNAVTQWADRESYSKRQREPLRTIFFGDAARLKEDAFAEASAIVAAENGIGGGRDCPQLGGLFAGNRDERQIVVDLGRARAQLQAQPTDPRQGAIWGTSSCGWMPSSRNS